jgi:hypothetical protein
MTQGHHIGEESIPSLCGAESGVSWTPQGILGEQGSRDSRLSQESVRTAGPRDLRARPHRFPDSPLPVFPTPPPPVRISHVRKCMAGDPLLLVVGKLLFPRSGGEPCQRFFPQALPPFSGTWSGCRRTELCVRKCLASQRRCRTIPSFVICVTVTLSSRRSCPSDASWRAGSRGIENSR